MRKKGKKHRRREEGRNRRIKMWIRRIVRKLGLEKIRNKEKEEMKEWGCDK